MKSEKTIRISQLNDWQKSLLARISYLDIDKEAFQRLKNKRR